MKKATFHVPSSLQLFIPFFFITSFLFAQAPQGIPYQAVMRNADGSVMASSAVSLTFMIHDGSATGTIVYQESHALTSNAQGLVSCVVGNGVVSQGNFSNINWGSGAKFLHVMMGTTDLGTQQLLSVPYALYSDDVESRVSSSGDTLWVGHHWVIVPGISAANTPIVVVLGCMDAAACNYAMDANQDDGSCLYVDASCDDGNALTTNDVVTADCVCAGTQPTFVQGNGVTDIDGNFYPSIILGTQEWMQTNLAVTKYRNGNNVVNAITSSSWNTTNGAYGIYGGLAENNTTYGKLYNWYAVNDSRGICPTGWHVPSLTEWNTMEDYLGGVSVAGGKLKTIDGWNQPNLGATNESGFTGLSGGYRFTDGSYLYNLSLGQWWLSTSSGSTDAHAPRLFYQNAAVIKSTYNRKIGSSIRCVKD